MESEYTIHAYIKNQISLYAVKGESNSRTFIFNIIEKSGTIAPTSNAVPVDLMLDLTGYTVVLRIAGTNIQTGGTIITAASGKVSFTLPASFTADSGTYQCEIVLTKNNEQLGIIGIALTVAYPQIKINRADPEEYGSSKNIAFIIPKGTPYVLKFDLFNFRGWLNAVKRSPIRKVLTPGDKVFFGIKKLPDDDEYIFTYSAEVHQTYNAETHNYDDTGELSSYGKFVVSFTEDDTDIEPGIYYYSIAASVSAGDDTEFVEVTPPTPFRIRPMMIKASDTEEETT